MVETGRNLKQIATLYNMEKEQPAGTTAEGGARDQEPKFRNAESTNNFPLRNKTSISR